MSLFEQIKKDQLTARKAHDALATSLLTTLIGETAAIGKNDGNREVTDADVVKVIKKFVDGMDATLGYLKDSNPEGSATVIREKEILAPYMPTQMDEQALTLALQAIVADVGANLGKVMAVLKLRHAGQYDGKMASTIVKSII